LAITVFGQSYLTQNFALTRYYGLFGQASTGLTVEDRVKIPVPKGYLRKLRVNVFANTLDGNAVLTVRKNNAYFPAGSSLSLTFSAAGTGLKTISAIAPIDEDDFIDLEVITLGTVGTIGFSFTLDGVF